MTQRLRITAITIFLSDEGPTAETLYTNSLSISAVHQHFMFRFVSWETSVQYIHKHIVIVENTYHNYML